MPILSKDDLARVQDRPAVTVDMTEFGWGGSVLLRSMSGTQRAEMEREWLSMPEGEKLPPQFKERVLVRCLVDESGAEMFTMSEIDALGSRNGLAIDHLYKAAAKMNGLEKDSVQEQAKN